MTNEEIKELIRKYNVRIPAEHPDRIAVNADVVN